MKAMILAAGLGTRLRPLTNDRPKALVTIGSRTLLEITLSRLRSFGIREVILNAHHFADAIVDYLAANNNFGMKIAVSREPDLLDTGGGLKHAAWFFLKGNEGGQEPFILHNVDVISTIDLARMVKLHNDQAALATLAVQDRATARYLLFSTSGLLCGRRAGPDSKVELARPLDAWEALGFSGIHVISPELFSKLPQEGAFSIIDAYLQLATAGEKILGFRADEFYWRDLGRPAALQQAAADLATGQVEISGDA
jgi:NDP-sugar pyrophosphorylase family protein